MVMILINASLDAITCVIMGAITEGIKTGTWEGAWKGAISGAIDGAADGFMFGAIGGAISGAMNPKFCFVAGTLVMTKQGLKAIEEIQIGDQVLSYNDNLEIFEYKDVVEVYNNEATELCHIHTEKEEIVCTSNHSVLTSDGWKLASELTAKDRIKTSNGFVQILSTEIEQLKEKINVYNLNVLGYHTYVVGNELLVVHNKCVKMNEKKFMKDNKMDSKQFHELKRDIIKDSKLPKKYGKNPDIYYDNKTYEVFLRSRTNPSLELFNTGLKLIGYII